MSKKRKSEYSETDVKKRKFGEPETICITDGKKYFIGQINKIHKIHSIVENGEILHYTFIYHENDEYYDPNKNKIIPLKVEQELDNVNEYKGIYYKRIISSYNGKKNPTYTYTEYCLNPFNVSYFHGKEIGNFKRSMWKKCHTKMTLKIWKKLLDINVN